ncbi:uncharacterized protein LOC127807509 isoform X5 [Diospyros lotus]|uniref:uncharacterized protein LOC127807509 isoform X5 n=1 Tax=Diospyros lotus TaxID=55363 RepID=UPI002254D563|nr:uncharacterized protein LOC127807509 isoform X5 [Diospyros lotus]
MLMSREASWTAYHRKSKQALSVHHLPFLPRWLKSDRKEQAILKDREKMPRDVYSSILFQNQMNKQQQEQGGRWLVASKQEPRMKMAQQVARQQV